MIGNERPKSVHLRESASAQASFGAFDPTSAQDVLPVAMQICMFGLTSHDLGNSEP
jgi:hypothetical protein